MANALLDALRPQPTGGLVVTFREGVERNRQERSLSDTVGAGVRSFSTRSETIGEADADTSAMVLEDFGIAIIPERGEDTTRARDRLMTDDSVADIRPEFWMYALDAFSDIADRTWGIAATQADRSPQTGEGMNICILDTGYDPEHQDFVGRDVTAKSFVEGETFHDGQGHGTHCAGTAAGRVQANNVPRYGVAPNAQLHIGKVLNNSGSGRERDILFGMLWAISQRCEVISMSLGRPVRPGEAPSGDYERIGQIALRMGSLIVAAAGNESSRKFGFIAPVGAPANSPSIMAVAAIDQALDVAEFSCGGINAQGGEVNIAAPGVGVFSSVPRPRNYAILRGTSMACPHVAGIAALWAESDPDLRGRALWEKVEQSARRLDLPPRDVGAGLALAPSDLVA